MVDVEQLGEAVARIGYRLELVALRRSAGRRADPGRTPPISVDSATGGAGRWSPGRSSVVVLALSITRPGADWARWTAAVLTVPVQYWAGWPFLRGAVVRARVGTANMDTLVAIGTLSVFPPVAGGPPLRRPRRASRRSRRHPGAASASTSTSTWPP